MMVELMDKSSLYPPLCLGHSELDREAVVVVLINEAALSCPQHAHEKLVERQRERATLILVNLLNENLQARQLRPEVDNGGVWHACTV